MIKKHAYMIMAHHREDLLECLISALDDERNDIFVHIDKKSMIDENKLKCNHSNLIFTERINVNWGGYSQIACELLLMKTAVSHGSYEYYHFLSGANYPLKNQDYIHSFFVKNNGKEFIGFDNAADYSERTKYYILFSEYGKLKGITGKCILALRSISVFVQKLIGIDRNKKHSYAIKKGCAYFSLTSKAVKYILDSEKAIYELCHNTICCDEVFVQTLIFNSFLKNNIYNLENEWDGCMREFAWPSNIGAYREGWNYSDEDINYLLNSERLFAMKFEGEEGIKLIKKIKQERDI